MASVQDVAARDTAAPVPVTDFEAETDIVVVGGGVTVPVMGDRPAGGAREPADLAIRNGKVYTGDAASPSTSAVAITGGVFTAVGDDDAVARYVRSTTRIPSCRSWLSLHWLTTGRDIGGNPLDA